MFPYICQLWCIENKSAFKCFCKLKTVQFVVIKNKEKRQTDNKKTIYDMMVLLAPIHSEFDNMLQHLRCNTV